MYRSAVADNNSKRISFRGELYRKLTHLFALIIPAGYYILGLDKTIMLAIMVPAAIAMIVIDIGRLRGWRVWNMFGGLIGVMIRDHEEKAISPGPHISWRPPVW